MEAMAASGDISMAGQTGVVSYTTYLASGKKRVASKNNDDRQYIRESVAVGSFTVQRGVQFGTCLKLDGREDSTSCTNVAGLM